jgi:hypothetical protein
VSKPIVFGITILLVGCATSERIVPAPVVLPEEGSMVSFAELHPKLRQLAWKATEAFYRDDWKDLVETSQSLEKAARLLRTSKEAPTRLQPILAAKCDELTNESIQLREASQAAAIDRIGAHLQRINNIVREIRPDI